MILYANMEMNRCDYTTSNYCFNFFLVTGCIFCVITRSNFI